MIRLARSLTSVGFAVLVSTAASAQVTDQKSLSLDGARTVADAAAAEARKHNAGGAIAVVDAGGHLVYLARLDKTFPAASTVATEKARTAATFRRPTRDFENAIKSGRTSLLGVSVMTPLQGGVPIIVDGQVVGAVGVSGASSAQEDDDIATVAAVALSAPVTASARQ
jgi:glc operon protein GlcG